MAGSTMKILNCSEIFFKKWNIQELFFETETLFSFSTYILFGLHLKEIYQFYLINFLLSHETVYKAGR